MKEQGKRLGRRFAGALLALVMVLGMVPGTVRTAEAATTYSHLFPVKSGKLAYVYGYSSAYGDDFHKGIDIHATSDDTIYAACGGTVGAATDPCSHWAWLSNHSGDCGHFNTFGNYIRINNDDGTYSYYGHLAQGSLLVKAGQRVERGQAIATMGASGAATGKHLHYEVRTSSTNTNATVNTNPVSSGGSIEYSYSGYGNEPVITYTNITAGTYYLRNKTAAYLNADGTANKSNLSVTSLKTAEAQRFVVSGGKSNSISASFNSALRVNPFSDTPTNGTNVNLYSGTEVGSDMHWGFEAVSGGYMIHNISYPGLVLGLNGTNVQVETKSGASDQIWELIPATYTISYSANGGSGAPAAQTKKFSENLTLSAAKPTLSGYTFKGWATTANAAAAQYQPGGTYTGNGNATLYAVWEKESEPVTLTGITVASTPTKTVYEIGEALDTAGLTLTAAYSDGSTKTVTEGYTVSGYDSAAAGEKTVTVTYEGKTVSFTVTVNEAEYKYYVINGEATISGYTGAGGDVVIPDTLGGYSVTTITNEVFRNRTDITSITLPNGVKTIGSGLYSYVFSGCTSLASVTIGKGITYIGGKAFAGCKSLAKVHITNLATWCKIKFEDQEANPLYNGGALYVNGEIAQDIEIPNEIVSIGANAFFNYSRLRSVVIAEGVTRIGVGAFHGCTGLKNVIIPNSVVSIGASAFYGCSQLAAVELPDEIFTIESNAFKNCGIKELEIPKGVTTINSGTFAGCSKLTSVTIPEGVVNIENEAFSGCSKLEKITISKSVVRLGDGSYSNVFSSCNNLTEVAFLGEAPEISHYAFYGTTATVYYPVGDDTWTEDVRQNYGGTLTWVAHGEVESEPVTLTSIAVASTPTKTVYEIGEALDTAGLTLTAAYSDGSTQTITTGYTVSGYDSAAAGEKTVTVTYEGKMVSFTVTVNEAAPVTPPTDPTAAAVYAQTVSGRPGETVTLALSVRNNPGVAYLKLKVNYDSALELVSATNGGIINGTFTTSKTTEVKPYVLTWTGTENSTDSGCMAQLTFRIAEDAEDGAYTVMFDCDEAYNEEFDDVTFTMENATVEVKSFVYGDLNDDGSINGKDAILLARYLAEWDVLINMDAADVNADGKVNGKDAIVLARYLAEWDVTLGQ